MTNRNLARTGTAALSALAALAATPALAHHPLGGGTPETFAHGVLSGIGHPMLGLDHFAFVVAMALVALAAGRLWTAPLAFLGASAVGVLLSVGGIALPLVEVGVAASALLLGLVLLSGRGLDAGTAMAIFAAAGIFHGHAYGAAVVGAETTPVAAYLLGLSLTQYAIAVAAGLLAAGVWRASDAADLPLRLAGGVAAGIGFTFLFEQVEGMILPALA